MKQKRLTLDEIEHVCRRYQSGDPSSILGREFGISPEAIRGLLRRRGIQRRTPQEAQRKCTINEHAFDVVTEASAYWIGFLMADGTIVQGRNTSPEIAITLCEDDVLQINAFREFLGSSHKIISIVPGRNNYSKKNAARFSVKSERLVRALSKFGVVPNKTKRAQVIDLEQDRHFWRGVVDGDGYVAITKDGRAKLELVGSQELLQQFVRFIQTTFPACRVTVRPHKSIYRVGLCGHFAVAVTELLYTDCTVVLQRKLNAAKNIAARIDTGQCMPGVPGEGDDSIAIERPSVNLEAPSGASPEVQAAL